MHAARFSLVFLLLLAANAPADTLTLNARSRKPLDKDPKRWQPVNSVLKWDAKKTMLIVCDVWDRHWCNCATQRVEAMAPRMNRFIATARERGVFIVHAPSNCMDFYKDTPQRKLAQSAPAAKSYPRDIDSWCRKLSDEPPLPIDDSDGGCDDEKPVKSYQAWKRQIATIEIKNGDAVSDSGREIYNLMESRGITNVMLVGVHTNMCVLGRPFGLRQMSRIGKNVVLVRDLTDSMYNPKRPPFVSHDRGTELVVEHIEKYVCPSILSTDLIPADPPKKVSSLPGTAPLTIEGDLASHLVDGVDRFLQRKIEESAAGRAKHWQRKFTSAQEYEKSVEPNRKRLAHILGVRDARVKFDGFTLLATTTRSSLVARGPGYEVHAVRWPAFGEVHGEGLLLEPSNGKPRAVIVAIPDADVTPEQLAGLTAGLKPQAQLARVLAQSGCRVVVPALVSREMQVRNNRARMTHREFIYRSAFELGRHILGYEVQKVLAVVDSTPRDLPVGVIGHGEGGFIALAAAALEPRLRSACVSGFFDDRDEVWRQPIDRNVFGLLEEFGDAELATLVYPRNLVIEACRGPEVTLQPGMGGAPGRLWTPRLSDVRREVSRVKTLLAGAPSSDWLTLAVSEEGQGEPGSFQALRLFLRPLGVAAPDPKDVKEQRLDRDDRMKRLLRELDRHNQELLAESAQVRNRFMARLDFQTVERYSKSAEPYREFFAREVIGSFDDRLLPFNARSRKVYDRPRWEGYEVVLDVYPDVIAFGVLLLPRDLKKGEKRPVVVCQHGLEGRPGHVIEGDHPAYHDFAARLAERGFIVFAPQNLYLFHDRFRTLQRKANPLKKTLFSIIVPQHRQIVNWLKTLPNVDPQRIAFYGLSYGGKTAMRVPALVTDYCLSICSADFNEWVWKNASTRSPYSYVWTMEYEIFEFDLGSTFNYAEMAALIAPRPFMVERGHFDGVAPDEMVAHEFARVRHLYQARLKLKDRCEIEWFVGPHTINGQGTFAFLHRHLNWPSK